jgi:phosphopantetheine--protein transferase-like protein
MDMILGIGVDSIEIARVASKCLSTDSRFMEKMFTPHEVARSLRNVRSPYQHLAACFAAREAFFKATQVWYMRANTSIAQRPSGEPYYVLTPRITEQLLQLYGAQPRVLVTLTHDEQYATAFAVCESG